MIPRYHDTVTPSRDEGGNKESKAMTLRLPGELHERLAAVAEVEGEPIAEVVRRAVSDHVEQRRRDPEFRAKVQETLQQHRRLIELLGED